MGRTCIWQQMIQIHEATQDAVCNTVIHIRTLSARQFVMWPRSCMQEVEERLKQKVQPLAADLSLPSGLEKKMKTGQKGGGYGGSKEATGYTKVRCNLESDLLHMQIMIALCNTVHQRV